MFKPMYIEIRWDGEIDYPSFDYAEILNSIIKSGNWEEFKKKYMWLSTIESSQGAIFNSSQIHILIEDVKNLLQEEYMNDIKDKVEEFLEILKHAGGAYVVFEGAQEYSQLSKLVLKEVEL